MTREPDDESPGVSELTDREGERSGELIEESRVDADAFELQRAREVARNNGIDLGPVPRLEAEHADIATRAARSGRECPSVGALDLCEARAGAALAAWSNSARVHEEEAATWPATDTEGADDGSDNVPLVIASAREVVLNHVGLRKLASVFTHGRSRGSIALAPCRVVATGARQTGMSATFY